MLTQNHCEDGAMEVMLLSALSTVTCVLGSRGQFGSGDKQRYGVGSKDAGINTELTRAENGLETQFLFGVA